MADFFFTRVAYGRILVTMFGLLAPIPVMWFMFTTSDMTTFLFLAVIAQFCAASALGGAAATSQALVLPRMRGVATATFFLATTLVGLALGPYTAGLVSAKNGDDLAQGMLATLWAAPVGLVLLTAAIILVPAAAVSVVERARNAGERI